MSSLKALAKAIPGSLYVRKIRYKKFFESARNLNLFYGIFANFAEAAEAAPKTKMLGYDHAEPAALYTDLMQKVGPSDYPAMFWLERLRDEVNSVFDFGGHVGIKNYAFSRYLSRDALSWTVYDLPAVVAKAKQIAADHKRDFLSFTDSLNTLEQGYDLLLASGSFQYFEDPLQTVFAGLKQKPKYLLINMLPLHETTSYVTLQNIGPSFCPYKVFKRSDFLSQLEGLGYKLMDEWKNAEKSCMIPFHDDLSVVGYSGLLLKRLS